MPEVGDTDKPRFILFFDEAHLMFSGASKLLLETIEQTVKLIRSKGVGVYFVTHSPTDIPSSILAQLGNRIQHAVRAYTAKDQRDLKLAVAGFRKNPQLPHLESVIQTLGKGEALVSVLTNKGEPTPAEKVAIRPPLSRLGPLAHEELVEAIMHMPYDEVDKLCRAQKALIQKRAEEARAKKRIKAIAWVFALLVGAPAWYILSGA